MGGYYLKFLNLIIRHSSLVICIMVMSKAEFTVGQAVEWCCGHDWMPVTITECHEPMPLKYMYNVVDAADRPVEQVSICISILSIILYYVPLCLICNVWHMFSFCRAGRVHMLYVTCYVLYALFLLIFLLRHILDPPRLA
jgi:hypothetical protein